MMSDEDSRRAQERAIAVFKRKAGAARSSIAGSARIGEGLRCEFTQGDHRIVTDMPAILGGGGEAPTPGLHARASIASCIAMGVKMAAQRAGLTLRSVTVDLEMDFDDGAMFGVGDNSAAPLVTRLAIRLDSDAPQSALEALVEQALAADPYYLALRDPAGRQDDRSQGLSMDAKFQLRVQRYGWDAAAPHYEAGWAPRLAQAQATMLDLADLRPGQSVLELACGSGAVTRSLAAAVGEGGSVLATDLAQKMVDATAALGLANVRTARMNAEALDVGDGEFDRAVCALGLMYPPDPAQALREMGRALRPGGRAAATVWGERRNCGWAEIFEIVDRQVRSEVCPMFFALGARGALAHDFERASFKDLRERRQSETLDFPDERSLLDAMLLGGPIALAVTRFSEAQMRTVSDDFLASVASFRTPEGGYRIAGEFVTVAGNA